VDRATKTLALSHLWIAFGAFALANIFGVYQVLERSGLIPALQSPAVYYASVSTHGVLMAFVLSTFFIMGFSYVVADTSLKQPIAGLRLAWVAFWLAVLGTGLAAVTLLSGRASVLFTFYPPILANPIFYIGLALVVVGALVWAFLMLWTLARWRRSHPLEAVPLAMFATAANAILWLWTSIGVVIEVLFQLLPLALGLVDSIDVGLARTLFSWTLHPIVYFWLIPAYIALYCFVPAAAGAPLFSDRLARLAFLALLLFGLPIGFHHLYMDPQQGAGWKLSHGVGTLLVAFPTFLTGFTVIASLEMAGRARGGSGLFGWIGALPWRQPMVLAAILSMLMLVLGGFGGVVNASYAMNAMVHNTAWVPGHFHLIYGGTVVIMYIAVAYAIWPKLTGKALFSPSMALAQLWLWFIGMIILTTPWHILGLLGQPRRISSVTYTTLLKLAWDPYEFAMIVGGTVLLISGGLFVYNLVRTHTNVAEEKDSVLHYAEALEPRSALPRRTGFALLNAAILVLMVANFGYPIAKFFFQDAPNPTAWGY
jgi:cytochrome c oxidase subunit 1